MENEKGGLDAALEAAGEGLNVGGKVIPMTEIQKPPPQNTPPTPEELDAFIAFTDIVTVQVCRGVSIVYKVPWTDDMRKAAMLSPTEKKQLALTAEPAYPYIRRLLENSAIIGAVLFVASYGEILWSKSQDISRRAPAPKREGGKKPGRPPKNPPPLTKEGEHTG